MLTAIAVSSVHHQRQLGSVRVEKCRSSDCGFRLMEKKHSPNASPTDKPSRDRLAAVILGSTFINVMILESPSSVIRPLSPRNLPHEAVGGGHELGDPQA